MTRPAMWCGIVASAFWISAASAQTANSSPTSPAPHGLSGSPPSASTTGPSGGTVTPGTVMANKGSAAGAVTEAERKAQAHDDKVMDICKGC